MKILPQTKLGKVAGILMLIFLGLMITAQIIVTLQAPRNDLTVFDNLLLAINMLIAFLAAISAFIVGLISIIKQQERSVLVFIITFIGLMILLFLIGEVIVPH